MKISTFARTLTLVIVSIYSFLLSSIQSSAQSASSKEMYLDIMQQAVMAYTPERIDDFIFRVEKEGITEHGFGRLTSNIGILVSKGRISEYKELFVRMMDIAAREVPLAMVKNKKKKPGNDFAVKELVCCVMECEKSGIFSKEQTDSWRNAFTNMKAEEIYSNQPEVGGKRAHNWCVFGSASECVRIMADMGGDRSYADKYLTDQLRFFDVNGMYRDPNQPMVYDFVARLQYMSALSFGYDGPARELVEEQLLKSAIPTLQMQSVTGEIPYGGRSNGFLHNDTFYAAVCEYYATWMKERGELELASRFKAAARRAIASVDYWTSSRPVRHIKNRYPTETGYGCEGYAYFDKYMVTTASWAYLAYRFADDSIPVAKRPEPASTFVTSPDFHQIVMNAGGYTVQIDLNAYKSYDTSGLGRFQRKGCSPVVGLHSPSPAKKPKYKVDIPVKGGISLSPGWKEYTVVSAEKGKVVLTDGNGSLWTICLSGRGVTMTLEGEGIQSLSLPAFVFDGESSSEITMKDKSLTVSFAGCECKWKTNGKISDSGREYGTRNGHLHRYDCSADGRLKLKGRIR